jgi:phenylpyruvate tautomerase PptA (4-oxalocrotonate tautomerase family)
MPILNIEIITRPDEYMRPELAKELADRTGEILGSSPGSTWVKVYFIARENYAENIISFENFLPVFVSVLKAKLQSPDLLQIEIAKLTAAVAEICGRPEDNIHIIYVPEGTGRVAFGGKLLLS